MRKFVLDSLVVENVHGIHIRPATDIYLLFREYPEVKAHFFCRNRIAKGNCINEILALNAGYQDQVDVKIQGPKAKKVFKKLKKKFSRFDKYRTEK